MIRLIPEGRAPRRHDMNYPLLAMIAIASFIVGCGPKKHPTQMPAQTTPAPISQDQRTTELQRRSADLKSIAGQLPGRDAQQDRALVADAFDRAQSALELLGGPAPTGSFRQQLRIIDSARERLRRGSADIPADPTIDSGLRSLYNALRSVRERLFEHDDNVKKQLEEVRDQLDDLDVVRGPMHSIVVAKVLTATSNLLGTMAGQLQGREAAATGATMQPQVMTEPMSSSIAAPMTSSPTHPAPAPAPV